MGLRLGLEAAAQDLKGASVEGGLVRVRVGVRARVRVRVGVRKAPRLRAAWVVGSKESSMELVLGE